MVKNKSKPFPRSKSIDGLVEFFDKHDLGDYWERLPKADFEVNIKTRKHLVAIDEKIIPRINQIAKSKKVTSAKLINTWLRVKVATAKRRDAVNRSAKAEEADVGPDTEFVGNPVKIRTTDGRSFNARVDIPRGDPALPLTDDELLAKYRECGQSQLRLDDIERSVETVLGLEKMADVGTLMAALRSPAANA